MKYRADSFTSIQTATDTRKNNRIKPLKILKGIVPAPKGKPITLKDINNSIAPNR